ncbi:hypothetical protein D9M68_663890 [compost metagenome]
MGEDDLAFLAGRLQGLDQRKGLLTAEGFHGFLGRVPHREDLVVHGLQRAGAIGEGQSHGVDGVFLPGTGREVEVPHQLVAVLRDREGRGADGVDHTVTAADQLRAGGVGEGALVDPVGVAKIAVARIDGDLEAVRIAREQCLLALRELVGILRHVGGGNDEQRLLSGIGVAVGSARAAVVDLGWSPQPLSAPGRNAAVGVAGCFSTHRREVVTQAFGLLRADLRQDRSAGEGCGENAGEERGLVVRAHLESPAAVDQKLYLALMPTLSRSAKGVSPASPRNAL